MRADIHFSASPAIRAWAAWSLEQVRAVADWPRARRLALVSAVLIGGFNSHLALAPLLDGAFPYFGFYYPGIVTAALLFGIRGGLLASVATVALAIGPFALFRNDKFQWPHDFLPVGVFILNGCVLIVTVTLMQGLARALRRSEVLARINAEQLEHFVEQAPVAIAMFDRSVRYVAASGRWRDEFGLAREFVGRRHRDVSSDIPDHWRESLRRALESESTRREEDELVRADGSRRWLRWETRRWRHADDGVGGVIVFCEDITETVLSRHALAESDQRLRLALRAANAGAWEWDPATGRSVWSDEFWRLLGLTPESRKPGYGTWASLVHPQDRAAVEQAVRDAVLAGRELRIEWRLVDAPDDERWFTTYGRPLRGEPASRYVGLVIEITERKRIERELRDNEGRLNAIVSTAMEAIVAVDSQGVIASANPAAIDMFGHEERRLVGSNIAILLSDAFHAEHGSRFRDFLGGRGESPVGARRRVEGKRKDGTAFPLELTVSEARFNGEKLFVGFMRDLSPIEEEKRRVDALRAELYHVTRLNDMGEVAAGLAHEVGQPIAAILNFAAAHRRGIEATGESPDPDLFVKIEAQARRGAEILKRLRGFIEKRPPERRRERIGGLIDDALALAVLRSRARILRSAQPDNGGETVVKVDPILIGQALINLLRNADDAIMDVANPEIRLDVALLGDRVRVAVVDNGQGVPPENLADLFNPFFSSKQYGLGVGLSISRDIVESHGGSLKYRPNEPRGSIFEITLPIARSEADMGAAGRAR